MGCSMSEAQEELLAKYFKSALLMLDGDVAGRTAEAECVARIGQRIWVKSANVPKDTQPGQLSAEEIHQLLDSQ